MGKHVFRNPLNVEKALSMGRNGKTDREIAQHFGIGISTVTSLRIRCGYRKYLTKKRNPYKHLLNEKVSEGKTYAEYLKESKDREDPLLVLLREGKNSTSS